MLTLALVALFACALAVFWPAGLPLAAILVLPLDPTQGLGITSITWSKIFLVFGSLRLLVDVALSRDVRRDLQWLLRSGGFALVAIALWSALSALWAVDRGVAFRETLKIVEYVLALFLGYHFLSRTRRAVVVILIAWSALLSTSAFLQFIGTIHAHPAAGDALAFRASGIFIGPNQAAGYFEAILAVGLAMLFTLHRPWRLLQSIAPIFSVVAVAAAGSRGGLAAVGAMGFSGILATFKARRWVPLALASAVLGAALVAFAMFQPARLASGLDVPSEISATQRFELWKTALKMGASRPMTGVGAGNYPVTYPRYARQGPAFYLRTHANNLYLNVLAELGIPGLLLYAILFVIFFKIAIARLKERSRDVWALVLLFSLTGTLMHSLVDDLLVYPVDGVTLFAIMGTALRTSEGQQDVTGQSLIPPLIRNVLLVVLTIVTPIFAFALNASAQLIATAGYPAAAMPFARIASHAAPYAKQFSRYAGALEFKNGRYEAAAQTLESSVGTDFESGLMAGDARERLGQKDAAIADWKGALTAYCRPGLDGWHYFQAELAAAGRGLDDEALNCMHVAMSGDPMQPVNYEQATAIAIQQHKYALARSFAAQGLKVDAQDPNLKQQLVQIETEQGHLRVAAQMIQSLPGKARAQETARLGFTWYAAGDYAQAKRFLEEAEKGQPLQGREAFARAMIARQENDAATAAKYFARPGAAFAAHDRAQELLSGGKAADAVGLLLIAARYQPDQPTFAMLGSVYLYQLNDAAAALPWLDRALRTAHSADRARLLAQRGDANALLKRWDDASRDFRASTSIAPSAIEFLHLGVAEERLHNIAGAEDAYKRAMLLDSISAINYETIVKFYMNSGRKNEARSWLQRGLKVAPEDRALQQLNSTLQG